MNLTTVSIEKPEEVNFILGQTHFIRTVEDVHEAIVTSVPGAKFGVAFCESSGPRLVRHGGTDPALEDLAVQNLHQIGAGRRRLDRPCRESAGRSAGRQRPHCHRSHEPD